MLKFLFLSITCLLFINSAECKVRSADTLAVLYGKDGHSVRNIDSAEWFMLIMPPDPGDNRNNVKGFYKDGKVKFVAKDSPNNNSLHTGSVLFDGDYISYYPNGKKDRIIHYKIGYKDGLEFLYYFNGKEYCCLKHQLKVGLLHSDDLLNWECFDDKGNLICKEGNGMWVTYADSNKTVSAEGKVVNGYMEGEWHGTIVVPDTIKYIYHYKGGKKLSSIAYDKFGKSYPFEQEYEKASYKYSPLSFVEILRHHIKLPRDANGKKMSLDTMYISFIIEKNGHINQFEMSGEVDPQLKDAVFSALAQFDGWSPIKIYGVPFRTQINLPLKETSGYTSLGYHEEIFTMKKL